MPGTRASFALPGRPAVRRPLPLALAVACALTAAVARPARPGDWLPLIECTRSADDTTLVAMTFGVTDQGTFGGTMGKFEFIPLSQSGIPAFPVESVSCPDGYACGPDSISGAVVVSGPIDTQHYPHITIRLRSAQEPYEARFYNLDGGWIRTKLGIETCASVTTPAREATWGAVKAVYR